MKTLPVEVSDGILRMPEGVSLAPKQRVAVIVLDEDDGRGIASHG